MPDLPTANDFNSSAIGGRNDSKSTDCLKPGEIVTNTCEEFLDRVLGFKFRTVAITNSFSADEPSVELPHPSTSAGGSTASPPAPEKPSSASSSYSSLLQAPAVAPLSVPLPPTSSPHSTTSPPPPWPPSNTSGTPATSTPPSSVYPPPRLLPALSSTAPPKSPSPGSSTPPSAGPPPSCNALPPPRRRRLGSWCRYHVARDTTRPQSASTKEQTWQWHARAVGPVRSETAAVRGSKYREVRLGEGEGGD